MPGEEALKQEAARELRGIDKAAVFWVDIAVATADGASAADVDWTTMDWANVRELVNSWLEHLDSTSLDPNSSEAWLRLAVPGREDVRLLFRARPRGDAGRGHRRQPSLVIAEPDPIPDLQFEDGATASLYDLPIETVRDLAIGHRRLALELPSHRQTWGMLLEQMEHFGQTNTSQIAPQLLESTASALGYVEAPAELGDFDEGWRAVHGFDYPLVDDPRDD